MIVCGCLGLGIWYRQQFLGRLHRIRELIAILEQWSSEVRYNRSTLPECCLRIGNCREDRLGRICKEVYEEYITSEGSGFLEMVVAEGSGRNGQVQGFRIGGKTATSQTLPRGSGRYISSFIGFAPADDPQVIAIAIINNPQGVYYGGQVAAPIIRQLYENILPYLGLEKAEVPEETGETGD